MMDFTKAEDFTNKLQELRPQISPADACDALGLDSHALALAQFAIDNGLIQRAEVAGREVPIGVMHFQLGFQLGTAWGMANAREKRSATFASCRDLAEAIINKDERIKKGELLWAILLGVALGNGDGVPRPELLLPLADLIDSAPDRAEALRNVFGEEMAKMRSAKG